jgi:hypothetical protein
VSARIISAEAARARLLYGDDGSIEEDDAIFTVARQGEQIAAALVLHQGAHWCANPRGRDYWTADSRCPTTRALEVTEQTSVSTT